MNTSLCCPTARPPALRIGPPCAGNPLHPRSVERAVPAGDGHAALQQDRSDVLIRREAWFEGQTDLDPARLVFVDESWASTNMARRYEMCPRGERLRMSVPHGHRKTMTLIAGLTLGGIVAPFVIDCPVNRDIFETWVGRALVPALRYGDTVIMDNLSSHKGPHVRVMIEAAGASLVYLPPYSPDFNPDFNPIEVSVRPDPPSVLGRRLARVRP